MIKKILNPILIVISVLLFIDGNAQVDIDPISPVSSCGEFALPPISGTGLDGSERYFDQQGGNGTSYNVGDIISTSITLFAYASVGGSIDEECFSIEIIPPGPIEIDSFINACAGYRLPSIASGLSLNAGYYTQSNRTGRFISPGTAIQSSVVLYASVGSGPCYQEQRVSINIGPKSVINFYSIRIAIFLTSYLFNI